MRTIRPNLSAFADISQSQLAETLGFHRSTVHRVLVLDTKPSNEFIAAAVAELGSFDRFFDVVDEPEKI